MYGKEHSMFAPPPHSPKKALCSIGRPGRTKSQHPCEVCQPKPAPVHSSESTARAEVGEGSCGVKRRRLAILGCSPEHSRSQLLFNVPGGFEIATQFGVVRNCSLAFRQPSGEDDRLGQMCWVSAEQEPTRYGSRETSPSTFGT
jgi:hypothetical protein